MDPGGQGEGGMGVPEVMQADDWQVGGQDVAGERPGDLPGVEQPPVLPGEHEARVGPGRAPGQPLGRLVFRHALSPAAVVGSRATDGRPFAVLGSETMTSWPTVTSDRRTATLARPRSTSGHWRPSSSPRRIPVDAASSQRV